MNILPFKNFGTRKSRGIKAKIWSKEKKSNRRFNNKSLDD
jgi:hypothetical protein